MEAPKHLSRWDLEGGPGRLLETGGLARWDSGGMAGL